MAFALLAAGASLLGGYMASRGAKKAAKQQAEGQRENIKFQREMADRAYGLAQPYINQGKNYLEMYGQNTGVYGQEGQQTALERYKSSPSYALLQDVIAKSTGEMEGAMASQGLFKSGAYGKELASHLSPIVLGDYYKNLAAIGSGVDMGQRGAQIGSGVSMQAGQNIGNALSNLGAINASGTVGSTNAMVGGINNALAGYGQAAGYGAQSGGYPLQYDPTWSNTRTSYL